MMKLSGNRSDGEGCFGNYYNMMDGTGVKVVTGNNINDSDVFEAAKEELKHMRIAYKCRRVLYHKLRLSIPKPIKFVKVDFDGEVYPGIVMEHIEGEELDHEYDELFIDACESFFHDSHNGNYIRHRWNDNVYRIDYGVAPTRRLLSLYRTLDNT